MIREKADPVNDADDAGLQFFTPPEVARLLKMKPGNVIAAIRRGELKASNVGQPGARKPRFRITRKALDEFLDRRSAISSPAKPARKRRQPAKSGPSFY